jgi:hypothetical protein
VVTSCPGARRTPSRSTAAPRSGTSAAWCRWCASEFEKLQTTTINGNLLLQGAAGNFIDLDAIGADPAAAYDYPPPPPVQPDQWIITNNGIATLSYMRVQQSYATIAITPDPTCDILPSLDAQGWNWNWYFFIPSVR